MNFYSWLTNAWSQNKHKTAVTYAGKAYSWAELENPIHQIANYVRQNSSTDDSIINIISKNNLYRFLSILGTIHQARIFSTDLISQARATSRNVIALSDAVIDEILKSKSIFPPLQIESYPAEESILRLASTSGSTGSPKWVVISVSAQRERIIESRIRIGQRNSEAYLFISGPSAWFARFWGAALNQSVLCLDHDAKQVLDFLIQNPNSNLYASPDQILFFIKEVKKNIAKVQINDIVIVGGSISDELYKDASLIANRILIQYASTECGHTTQNTYQPIDDGSFVYGQTKDDIKIQIRSPSGAILPPGIMGDVWIKTNYMANGYIDLSTGNISNFTNNWFFSGDQGSINDSGYFIYHGRHGDVVNVRGIKFGLQQIDNFFSNQPGIADAAAFLVTGEMGLDEVWVAVVLDNPIDGKALEREALEKLGYHRAPSRVVQVRAIPRTVSGKIRRQEMSNMIKKLSK